MATALIPLAKGFEDIEAVTIIDVLRRGGVDVVTASIHDGLDVMSAHGIVMRADVLLSAVGDAEYDAIVLPGGGEGTENLKKSEALTSLLHRQAEDERLICAICAAPTVLAAAGVLEGEDVTCYPSCEEEMGCPVVDVPAVADGQVITGRGPGAAITFALAVLMHMAGDEVAHGVAEGMVAEL